MSTKETQEKKYGQLEEMIRGTTRVRRAAKSLEVYWPHHCSQYPLAKVTQKSVLP